ncbi:MAG: hypothetical protein AAGJ34_05025 [Pseudomonadota bacterium]
MTKLLTATITVGLLVTSVAEAGPWRYYDRVEDRVDRVEDRIDSRVTYGKRDLAEDRVDRFENRIDERNLRAKCARNADLNCGTRASNRWTEFTSNRAKILSNHD